jgi:quinol monooxygenase YgiN
MAMRRREFLTASAALAMATGRGAGTSAQPGGEMYGLIGKMTTAAGKRDEFIAILLGSVGSMPGCLSYVVATDPSDADGIWITEVWDSQASHEASLALPAVKEAIAKGRPMITGFSNRVITAPVGGHGLTPPKKG